MSGHRIKPNPKVHFAMQVSFPNTKPYTTLCTPYLGVIPGVLDHEEAGHRHVLLVNIEQLGQPRVVFFLSTKIVSKKRLKFKVYIAEELRQP